MFIITGLHLPHALFVISSAVSICFTPCLSSPHCLWCHCLCHIYFATDSANSTKCDCGCQDSSLTSSLIMSAGSCAIIAAMLSLGGGRCAQGGQSTTYYCYYNTVLQPTRVSKKGVLAELCVYSPKDNVVLPDDTVVFAYTQIYSFPGNPSDNDNNNNLPEILPCLFATGIVRSVHDVTAIDNNKCVMLEISDHVQNGKKGFTFEYVVLFASPLSLSHHYIRAKFTGATSQWNCVPLPSLQLNAQIVSILCKDCHSDGIVTIEAESLTINALPAAAPTQVPPSKKRKYNAYIASGTSPSSPTASTSSLAGPSGSSQSTLPEPGSTAGEVSLAEQQEPEPGSTAGKVSLAEQQEPVAMLPGGSMEDTTASSTKAAGERKARQ
ncbi:uncharacterized protein PHACADRAFT_30676 [Phanerochaete carnosa HHB-10118-sp]|uniref:Uncharacterized protein n=1 Tax=Phanerochaete carnosa (strain HHB-10118-sp) TaxID=650164 RepID=K5UUP6_PHACS|nr:uncharacterized protein PHACADRAFT_30676 [Phanerochaete carnosa HHB-10118-sp]EKM53736.1 hypothetical protein PHACADRAFT_30676 [Phanerochaete carnosa HHB-10118-sp]